MMYEHLSFPIFIELQDSALWIGVKKKLYFSSIDYVQDNHYNNVVWKCVSLNTIRHNWNN